MVVKLAEQNAKLAGANASLIEQNEQLMKPLIDYREVSGQFIYIEIRYLAHYGAFHFLASE